MLQTTLMISIVTLCPQQFTTKSKHKFHFLLFDYLWYCPIWGNLQTQQNQQYLFKKQQEFRHQNRQFIMMDKIAAQYSREMTILCLWKSLSHTIQNLQMMMITQHQLVTTLANLLWMMRILQVVMMSQIILTVRTFHCIFSRMRGTSTSMTSTRSRMIYWAVTVILTGMKYMTFILHVSLQRS